MITIFALNITLEIVLQPSCLHSSAMTANDVVPAYLCDDIPDPNNTADTLYVSISLTPEPLSVHFGTVIVRDPLTFYMTTGKTLILLNTSVPIIGNAFTTVGLLPSWSLYFFFWKASSMATRCYIWSSMELKSQSQYDLCTDPCHTILSKRAIVSENEPSWHSSFRLLLSFHPKGNYHHQHQRFHNSVVTFEALSLLFWHRLWCWYLDYKKLEFQASIYTILLLYFSHYDSKFVVLLFSTERSRMEVDPSKPRSSEVRLK